MAPSHARVALQMSSRAAEAAMKIVDKGPAYYTQRVGLCTADSDSWLDCVKKHVAFGVMGPHLPAWATLGELDVGGQGAQRTAWRLQHVASNQRQMQALAELLADAKHALPRGLLQDAKLVNVWGGDVQCLNFHPDCRMPSAVQPTYESKRLMRVVMRGPIVGGIAQVVQIVPLEAAQRLGVGGRMDEAVAGGPVVSLLAPPHSVYGQSPELGEMALHGVLRGCGAMKFVIYEFELPAGFDFVAFMRRHRERGGGEAGPSTAGPSRGKRMREEED